MSGDGASERKPGEILKIPAGLMFARAAQDALLGMARRHQVRLIRWELDGYVGEIKEERKRGQAAASQNDMDRVIDHGRREAALQRRLRELGTTLTDYPE